MPIEKPKSPVLSHNVSDWGTPGVIVEVDAEEAEALGAFEETALSEEDVWESSWDEADDRYGE